MQKLKKIQVGPKICIFYRQNIKKKKSQQIGKKQKDGNKKWTSWDRKSLIQKEISDQFEFLSRNWG